MIPAERIKVARLLSAASVAPRVLWSDDDTGILVQEPLLNDSQATDEAADARMLEATAEIQSLVTVQGPEAERFHRAIHLAATATNEDHAVRLVDDAATELNFAFLGVKPCLRKCHPQIELLRIASYLRKNAWAVRPEFGVRARSLVRFLISQCSLIHADPLLQHGSMKSEHLMRRTDGSAAVCDLDHAGLYVGPYDIAHWFHERHSNSEVPLPFQMLKRIHRLASTDDDRFLGAVWFAVFPIYNALWRFACGDWRPRLWEMQFLTGYPEAFRKVFIQSRESVAGHLCPLGI